MCALCTAGVRGTREGDKGSPRKTPLLSPVSSAELPPLEIKSERVRSASKKFFRIYQPCLLEGLRARRRQKT